MIKRKIWALYQARLTNGALQEFTEIDESEREVNAHAKNLARMYENNGNVGEIVCLAVFGFDCYSAENGEEQSVLSNGDYEYFPFGYTSNSELNRTWYVEITEKCGTRKNMEILNEICSSDCYYYISKGELTNILFSQNCKKLNASAKHHIESSICDIKGMLEESCVTSVCGVENTLEECAKLLRKVHNTLEDVEEHYHDYAD